MTKIARSSNDYKGLRMLDAIAYSHMVEILEECAEQN